MANQNNFKTDVTLRSPKRLASRVFTNYLDNLLELQVPAMVPEQFDVEISLYSLSDNSLVYNSVFPSSEDGVFSIKALKYNDQSVRRMLFIDFSKTTIPFGGITGRYQIVINFFAREVGNLTTQKLWLSQVSPSRTELELQVLPEYNDVTSSIELRNFAQPQINKLWVYDAIKQIFNQSEGTASNIPTDRTSMTFDIVSSFLPNTVYAKVTGSTILSTKVENTTQNILNSAYKFATASIYTKINQGQERFTETDLVSIVSSSLSTAIANYATVQEFRLL